MAQTVKDLPTMRETRVQSLGWEDLLEKEMATHSSIIAWKKSHGQRSIVGYSPWGLKESDTTEQLHIHTYIPDVKTMRKKAKGFSTQTFHILQE